MKINLKIISSLGKSYRSTGEHDFTEIKRISGLKGETVSLQLDYCLDYGRLLWGDLTVDSDDPKLTESVTVRRVELVPVTRPVDPSGDDHYLESEPCALPDMLSEMPAGKFPLVPNYHRSLWMDVDIPEDIRAGIHEISFTVKCCWKEDNTEETVRVSLEIIDALLPELEIAHTEWFYGDCIADYYGG